jgi:RimJ/RimL family protein N-acetyltransferase
MRATCGKVLHGTAGLYPAGSGSLLQIRGSTLESVIFFTDGVVTVRPFQKEDAGEIHTAVSETQNEASFWVIDLKGLSLPEVQGFIASQPETWNEDRAYNFVILETSTNRILGGCGLTNIDRRHRSCRLYFWIRTSAARQGFATRAVLLMAQFAFDSLGMQRMELIIEPDNLAGLRVAEKSGAISEGYLRSRFFLHGGPKDAVVFSLVPEDLPD